VFSPPFPITQRTCYNLVVVVNIATHLST